MPPTTFPTPAPSSRWPTTSACPRTSATVTSPTAPSGFEEIVDRHRGETAVVVRGGGAGAAGAAARRCRRVDPAADRGTVLMAVGRRQPDVVVAELEAERIPGRASPRCGGGSAPDEEAFGVRHGHRSSPVAKRRTTDLPSAEVERLLGPPGVRAAHGGDVHPRLQGQAQGAPADHERGTLARTYLGHARPHHDGGTWSTARRPGSSGLWLVGAGDKQRCCTTSPSSPEPLRRRTAMTAPLGFLGTDDLEAGFDVAAHARRRPGSLWCTSRSGSSSSTPAPTTRRRVVGLPRRARVAQMRRPAVRLAVEKLAARGAVTLGLTARRRAVSARAGHRHTPVGVRRGGTRRRRCP